MSAQWKKRAACEEKDILLQDIGPWSQLSPQKHLLLPVPTGQGWSRDGCVPSAQRQGARAPAGQHRGTLVPCFGSVHDPAAAIPPLCSLPQGQEQLFTAMPAAPHLPVPTSTLAETAGECLSGSV